MKTLKGWNCKEHHIHREDLGCEPVEIAIPKKEPNMPTQTKPTHTPTPWKVVNADISDPTGEIAVARCKSFNGLEDEQAEANAAFIVRAVNSFQALVDDCRSSMEWFEANGYPTEAANIRRLLLRAEGKE